jgi:hypothetical protein
MFKLAPRTGVREGEPAAARVGWLKPDVSEEGAPVWNLLVLGKRRKWREVPLPDCLARLVLDHHHAAFDVGQRPVPIEFDLEYPFVAARHGPPSVRQLHWLKGRQRGRNRLHLSLSHLVVCARDDCTNKVDAFRVVARRKPQRYPVVSRIFATTPRRERRGFMCSHLGLSDCRTAHRDGFLVETTDGLETNVGHVCGKKAFPDFDLKRAEYKALRERRDLLDRASAIKSNVTGIRNRIAELDTAQFGSVWVESVRAAVGKVLGSDLFDSLRVAQMRGDLAVRIERERSAAEIKQIIDFNPRQRREQVRTETITVGYLEPMPWLTFAFKGKLRDGLLGELERFACANHASMATPTLKRAVKALDGYERVVDEACEAAGGAVKFFAPENLAFLVQWVPDRMRSRRQAVAEWAQSAPCKRLAEGRLAN